MLFRGEAGAGAHLEGGDRLVAADGDGQSVGAGEGGGGLAVRIMLHVGPCVVEGLVGQQGRLAQIILGAVHRFGAGRDEVFVDGHMRLGGDPQDALCVMAVDLIAVAVEAVVQPRVERHGPRGVDVAVVGRADGDGHTLIGQFVCCGDGDVERVAQQVRRAPGLGDGGLGERFELPERAVAVAVDGVVALMLVDGQFVGDAFEGVGACLDTVRERNQHLPLAAGDGIIGTERDDDVAATVGELAQRSAEFGDDGLPIAACDRVLLAGTRGKVLCHNSHSHSVDVQRLLPLTHNIIPLV